MSTFNVEEQTAKVIAWIRAWFEKNGPQSPAVIGISGGKDSSTVAALCCQALGKDRVIGVLMPQGVQPDIDASYLLVKHLRIKHYVVNVGSTVDAALQALNEVGITPSLQCKTNLPARVRMTTLYAVSQSFNGRVSCNCNLSENVTGYSTRFGDDAGDFAPLHTFTVQEVIKIGQYLGLPEALTQKVPSDGLSGKTDEDNMGFRYADLDALIREGKGSEEFREMIVKRYERNKFKLEPIAHYDSGLEMKI